MNLLKMTSKRSRKDILSVSYRGLDLAKLVKIFGVVLCLNWIAHLLNESRKKSVKLCSLPSRDKIDLWIKTKSIVNRPIKYPE